MTDPTTPETGAPPLPSEVRARLVEAHGAIRERLARAGTLVAWLREGHAAAPSTLKTWAEDLHQLLVAHMEEEERLLLPALTEADGFGPTRAAALQEEHEAQRRGLQRVLAAIVSEGDGELLADRIELLVARVRRDMDEEEAQYLSARLLKDDLVPADYFGG
ncbi:MAG: hemerythrin domain-containing protein [Myxococcota bacterium]